MGTRRNNLYHRRPVHIERLESRDLLATVPIFSTGVANDGTLLAAGATDPHFQIISAPAGGPSAFVLNDLPGGYVANTSASQWIGPSANPFDIDNSGDYTYRETFDLTGLDPSTVVVQGQIASDNDSTIELNGADTGVALVAGSVVSSSDFASLHPFTLTKGFVAGLNTIEVVVHNDYSATGLQLELSGTASTAGPQPPPAPLLTSAIQGSNATSVQGTLAGVANTQYLVDFSTTSGGPSIGSTTVTAGPSGQATIATNLPVSLSPGASLYATATGPGTVASASSAAQVVVAIADLSVTPTTPTEPTLAGNDLTLTFVLSENGPSPASDVVFDETLPAGIPVASVSATAGTATVADGVLHLDLPSFSATGSVTVSAVLRPSVAGILTASASVSSDVLDPTPANNSANLSFQVAPSVPTLNLSTDKSPSVFGAPVTFTATVTPASSGDEPTGDVTFSVDGAAAATVPLTAAADLTGKAIFTTSALGTGTHGVTASYGGDTVAVSQMVQPAATVTNLAISPNTPTFGQPLTLTATVAGPGHPTGTVNFQDGSTLLGQAPLGADGRAQLVISSLTTGSHTFTANYGGDANFSGSDAGAITQIIESDTTSTSLTIPPSSPIFGQAVMLTATVSAGGNPTGIVTFYDDSTSVGQAPLDANGQAQLVTSLPTVGSHALTASYGGDANFLPSLSSAVKQVVNAVPTVVAVQRFGIHSQPTTLVLTFSTPLDPASAQKLSNYELDGPKAKPVPVVRAALSADGLTVTLQPKRRLNVHLTYFLEVVGRTPGGVTSSAGFALDGASNGLPGSDFVAEITLHTLAQPHAQSKHTLTSAWHTPAPALRKK